MRSLYRWYVMDPIRFQLDFRMTVQQIGIFHGGLLEPQDQRIHGCILVSKRAAYRFFAHAARSGAPFKINRANARAGANFLSHCVFLTGDAVPGKRPCAVINNEISFEKGHTAIAARPFMF